MAKYLALIQFTEAGLANIISRVWIFLPSGRRSAIGTAASVSTRKTEPPMARCLMPRHWTRSWS